MKNLMSIIAMSIITLMATAQIDTTGMSDYEKYYYIKTGEIDTTKKNTVKSETDDVYYKGKQVTTIFERNRNTRTPEERKSYNNGYNDGYEEGVEDISRFFEDDFSYANRFYRFNYGFGFSYYSPYWRYHYGFYDPFWFDPFWLDPWYYDPWYWNPYYNYYPYYSYRYDYYPVTTYITYRNVNRGFSVFGNTYYDYQYHSPNKVINPRAKYDTRNVSILNDTRVNSISSKPSYTVNNSRRISPSTNASVYTQSKSVVQTQQRRESTNVQKPTYKPSERTYTPSYNRTPVTTRPRYNNTPVNRDYVRSADDKVVTSPRTSQPTYTTPRTNNSTRSSAPAYSSPRSSAPSYSSPRSSSSSYSTPNRSSSSYSTPSRSTYNGSDSRSMSSGNGGSVGKRR